jgi:hypothetical protein
MTPSDTSSNPTAAGGDLKDEQSIEHMKNICYERSLQLSRLGGRPTHDLADDYDPHPASNLEAEQRYHVSDHWGRKVERAEMELDRWMQFRWHQFKAQRNLAERTRYIQAVHSYKEEQGLVWVSELSISRQTKVDEWKEYFIYEGRISASPGERYSAVQVCAEAEGALAAGES